MSRRHEGEPQGDRRPAHRHEPPGAQRVQVDAFDLDLYEVALLRGGSELAAAVAAVELYRNGTVGVDGYRLVGTGPAEAVRHPLERAVHQAVLDAPPSSKASTLLFGVREAAPFLDVEARLAVRRFDKDLYAALAGPSD